MELVDSTSKQSRWPTILHSPELRNRLIHLARLTRKHTEYYAPSFDEVRLANIPHSGLPLGIGAFGVGLLEVYSKQYAFQVE